MSIHTQPEDYCNPLPQDHNNQYTKWLSLNKKSKHLVSSSIGILCLSCMFGVQLYTNVIVLEKRSNFAPTLILS